MGMGSWPAGALVLLAAWILPTGVATAEDPPKIRFFRIASGAAGGTYFPMAGLLAQVITNPPGARGCAEGGNCGMDGLVAIAQSAHGSVANVKSLDKDQVESAFAQSDITYWAYTGTGPFSGKEPVKKLCVLTSLYPEHIHLVAGKGAGFKSVADLKDTTVGLGLPASGALVGARLVMDAYGLMEKRDFRPEYIKTQTGADMVRAGKVDAFFAITGYPNAAITELAAGAGMTLIPIDGKERDALIKRAPFYSADAIPGGTYKGQPKPVETVAVSALWISRSNLPEDLQYGVIKGLYGNKQAEQLLRNGHARGKSVTLATYNVGVPIPFCPGAVKFYKEMGVYKAPAKP